MSLYRNILLVCACSLWIFSSTALANPDQNKEIENLKRRIEVLEAQQTTQSDEQELSLAQLNEYLSLSGLIEVESSFVNPEGGNEESDLSLATVELSLDATINEFVGGHITLLYEEGENDDEIAVDEGVINISSPGQLFGQTPSLHAGRMYVPFGMFSSYMVSDPLTLDLGETQNTAALVALEGDIWTLQAGAFNGDVDTKEDNDIDSWVAALDVTAHEKIQFGLSYISDLAESEIELVTDEDLYSSSVSGASAYLSLQFGDFGLEAEYLAALEDFDRVLVGLTDLTGRRPEAWNLELAWMPLERMQLAARYEQAEDFQDDVRRYGATVSYGLYEQMVVALEYLHADAKVAEDDPTHAVTAQLALEF